MAFAPILSAVVGAVGSIMSAMSAMAMADYQKKVSDNNAKIASMAAQAESLRGSEQAHQQDLKNKALRGQQRAAYGAAGVDMNEGSPLDAQESSAVLGRMDTLNVKHNSEQKRVALLNQSSQFTAEGQLAGMKGESSMLAGFIGAGQSILGGITSYNDRWSNYKAAGMVS